MARALFSPYDKLIVINLIAAFGVGQPVSAGLSSRTCANLSSVAANCCLATSGKGVENPGGGGGGGCCCYCDLQAR